MSDMVYSGQEASIREDPVAWGPAAFQIFGQMIALLAGAGFTRERRT